MKMKYFRGGLFLGVIGKAAMLKELLLVYLKADVMEKLIVEFVVFTLTIISHNSKNFRSFIGQYELL